MEMCYDGALVMPSKFAVIDEEEMTYVEGGRVDTMRGTAKRLKGEAEALMVAWYALAGGYTAGAAAAVASVIGVVAGAIATLGAGYCISAGNEYKGAYNYFSTKSQTSSKLYYMSTISSTVFVTGVEYGAV